MNSQFGSSASSNSHLGSTSSHNSQYGSAANSNQQVGLGYRFGASSEMQQTLSQAEQLAKLQAQSLNYGGTSTGASQIGALSTSSGAGFGGLGAGANYESGYNGLGSGYKTKSWEKASKWSSQSEVK